MFAMHSGNRAPGVGAIPRTNNGNSSETNMITTPAGNDVVFGLRCPMFKAAVETAVERLEENLGSKVNWTKNNSALLQEVTNEALKCLKKGGGRFLQLVIKGRGLKPEGYIHYEDEDAYKKMEWYINKMGQKRENAELEMDSSDDDDDDNDDDDDDDESSITSKFSQVAVANEEEYNKPIQPTEGVDIQPTEGVDVVLSLTDEQYKKTMFRKFDALGPKETPANMEAENEAVQQIFDEFKSNLKSSGRLLMIDGNYRIKNKKYRIVDDEEARNKIYRDMARRNHSAWHNKGKAMQVNTKKGGNAVAKRSRGRPPKSAKKRGSIIKNFSRKTPFLSKSSKRAAGKAKASSVGNRKASEYDTDGLSDSDDSSVESTSKVAKKDIVEMPLVIKLFNDIKTKVKSSRGSEKVFYIHLKKYIAQQIKKDGVLRSDFDKIQDFMSRMIPNVNMLNEATDEDEIIVYEAAINAFIKECKAELPLSFFIKLE